MLLVFSACRERLAHLTANLERHVDDAVVAIDRAEMVQRLVELNVAKFVVLDQPELHRAWLRYFVRKFPHVHCVLVGIEAADVVEMLSLAPNSSVSIGFPDDWNEFLTVVWNSMEHDAAPSAVSAVGAEDVLHLLGMTGSSAELEFAWGSLRGRMCVRDGVVVHAERRARRGADVACELLSWPEASVTSRASSERGALASSMHMSPAALLHEVALRTDEIARFVSGTSTQRVLDWLLGIPGVGRAALVQVDTSTVLSLRDRHPGRLDDEGPSATQLTWIRRCYEAWDDRVDTTSRPRAVEWRQEGIDLLMPLGRRLALLVSADANANLGVLRDASEQAGGALNTLGEPASRSLESRVAVQWG